MKQESDNDTSKTDLETATNNKQREASEASIKAVVLALDLIYAALEK